MSSEDVPLKLRRLRAQLLAYAADLAAPKPDDDLLRGVLAAVNKVPLATFLSETDGYFATLDHAWIGSAEVPPARKSRRSESAVALAAVAPVQRTVITAGRLGAAPPLALMQCAAANGAPSGDSLLDPAVAHPAFAATGTTLTDALAAADHVVQLLQGSSGSNPGRGGVSLQLTDTWLASPPATDRLQRLAFVAAAKLSHALRAAKAPTASAVPREAVAAGEANAARLKACAALADARSHGRAQLAAYVALGELDGLAAAFSDANKDAPPISEMLSSLRVLTSPAEVHADVNNAPEQRGWQKSSSGDSSATPMSLSQIALRPPTTSSRRSAAANKCESIRSEVSFSGTASTARDVDRLFGFCRETLEGGLSPDRMRQLLLDRKPGEPRALLPTDEVRDVLAEGNEDDDDAPNNAQPTPLERMLAA